MFGVLLAILLIHLVVIVGYGFISQPQKSSHLIILGNKVELNGQPSQRLQYRLDKGLELFQQGYADTIIVSGGMGKEGFDEAEVMAHYLIQKGIPKAQILQDNQGITTYFSAKYCEAIHHRYPKASFLIVSQYFHLLRSHTAFNQMGIPHVSVASADYVFEWRDFYSIAREMVGIYYYLLRSYE